MSLRTNVSPDTLGVDLREEGVAVRYTDGREVLYRGVPEKVDGSLETPPGKDVHVLVTDPTETEGVMMYVNDRKTHDEILESTGVGRLLLDRGDEEELFPGVEVTGKDHSVLVDADPTVARGRVFVFAEDDMGEHTYELVGEG